MEENFELKNEEEVFDNTLTVTDENNIPVTIEVLDIFKLDQYPDKEYIFYTKNEEEGEYLKTYVSILNEQEETASLDAIEDEAEFNLVQQYINNQAGE